MRRSSIGAVCFVMIGCLAISVSSARADLSDGLVAYYSFDDGTGEVLKEQTGNAPDGDLFNFDFADTSNWADGLIGGALSFDGFDDYIIVPDFPLATTAMTVSIWGYVQNAPPWASLVKNWGGGVVGQFHFGLGVGDADTLNIFTTDSTGAANRGTDLNPIEFEVWEHYAFVADPAEQIVTLYRNGEAVDEQPYDGTFTPTPVTQSLGIGAKTNDAGDAADGGAPGYWDGLQDDLGIWHRALTGAEIVDIYTRGLAGQPLLGGAGLPGDYDGDGVLSAADADILSVEIRQRAGGGALDATYDANGDGDVTGADLEHWVRDPGFAHTWIGDADVNGEFNTGDLVQVLAAGTYEVDIDAVWSTGDFNADGRTDSGDLVAALADGGYEQGAAPAAAVPEPSSLVLALAALALGGMRRRVY